MSSTSQTPDKSGNRMVGVTGIEPVTPTMSTMLKPADTLVEQETGFDKSGTCSLSDHAYHGRSLGGQNDPSDDLIRLLDEYQPRVREAAMWLYLNRSTVAGNVLVALRRKFSLTIIEATDAANAAHKLTYR